MTKIPRIHIEGAVYYVTSRGDNNENIFKDDADYSAYLGLLKKYKEQYRFKLFASCLMPNHLHLLMELKEGLTISEIMHDLSSNYTKYVNGKYERKGHLFQERYKMNLLEKKTYLLCVTAYIHLNPKAAGLVGQIKDYVYSTYLYYTQEPKNTVFGGLDIKEEVDEVLGYLGEKNYPDYLAGVSKDEMETFAKDLRKNPIMGQAEFIKTVDLKMAQQPRLTENQTPNTKHQTPIMVAGIALAALVIFTFGLYRESLGLKKNFGKELEKKEKELSLRVSDEKKKVYKDLDEKYRADMVSYQALSKRLEIEKNKTKELEEKLGKIK